MLAAPGQATRLACGGIRVMMRDALGRTLRRGAARLVDNHASSRAQDYERDKRWRAFDPFGRKGGTSTTGVVVDSGMLNPELLKGKKGGRIWPRTRLKDRIDAIIAHEYEELRRGSHVEALKAAARTDLPISDEARRLCRAMAR